ncbi:MULTISPECIES: prepilin-type N-terminal cleavage/methylation domain-containing protein [Sphingomonas]|mgnify:CR=1 FL=1|jgi:type II secretory pathway pseudopilin PulG|uniref:prepilin-type N-terminal cleavage/methylation domain-containing protein n=1 Tax=Sphingomonas TaxID=13687 RepID=UPI001AE47A03
MKPDSSEAGFSLVETLVAFAVIAAMSGVYFETVIANARFAENVTRRREAVLLAQSLLAAAAAPNDSNRMADKGATQGLTWDVMRRAHGDGARDTAVPLEEVQIVIADRATGRRLTSVRTLRLAR